ncbi:MAG TPA: cytochrome P450 [Streptosporangiaceae bacterium]|nr:cytochrome P450 [Streptosporangiaceae bacterium]
MEFDPFVEPHREDPFAFFSWAREHAPVTYVPALGAWMISRYDDVVRVLNDTEAFSSQNALARIDRDNPPEVLEILSAAEPIAPVIVQCDSPDHAPHRLLWRRLFRGARISALKPRMQKIAEELVDAFAGDGHADLVGQFSRPHILRSVCALVGIPEDDHERVAAADWAFLMLLVPNVDVATKKRAAEQYVDHDRYLLDLFDQRRARPADDMLTELVALIDDPDEPFTVADVLMLIRGIFAAGTHTPADAISATLLNTLSDREHWERMLADPSVIPGMIEETLRRDAPHRGLMRITTREIELHGVHLPAGSAIFPMLGSANRDGEHFAEPDAFRPARDGVRTHVAFGHGPHDCIGAHLARTQARIALTVLAGRLPDLHLAADFSPAHYQDWFFWGLDRLDVTWPRAHRDAPTGR